MTDVKIMGFKNTEWHLKHQLPDHPTLEQRVRWHMEHARNCPCPSGNEDLIEELKRRYLGKHQDFWIFYHINDHRALGLWAAECAERLLPYFESRYPRDTRPRDAIKTLRKWAETGEFCMAEIRKASLAAHASAKEANQEDMAAIYAAHAAGQAVGTAHVPTHVLGVILYSIKLVACLNLSDVKKAVEKEREWQNQHLPENLQPWINFWLKKMQTRFSKKLRALLD
ncbi:MAG: putative immunity protein [bacterium]